MANDATPSEVVRGSHQDEPASTTTFPFTESSTAWLTVTSAIVYLELRGVVG